jgi:hypothetical protein
VLIVRSLSATQQISDNKLRALVEKRINDLGGECFDADAMGYFLIVEPGDTFSALEKQLGFPMLCNRFTGIRFDAIGFTPSFEFVEEFPFCYDMVFIISDDGFGIEVFVSKEEGVQPDLLEMCRRFAFQSQDEEAP